MRQNNFVGNYPGLSVDPVHPLRISVFKDLIISHCFWPSSATEPGRARAAKATVVAMMENFILKIECTGLVLMALHGGTSGGGPVLFLSFEFCYVAIEQCQNCHIFTSLPKQNRADMCSTTKLFLAFQDTL